MRSVDSDKEDTVKERASKSVQDPGVFSFRFQVSLLVLTLGQGSGASDCAVTK